MLDNDLAALYGFGKKSQTQESDRVQALSVPTIATSTWLFLIAVRDADKNSDTLPLSATRFDLMGTSKLTAIHILAR
jgi:hypothetical protein